MSNDAADFSIGKVLLRDVEKEDLPTLYEHQREPEACRMAAFASRDWPAFLLHWQTKILGDSAVIKKTILVDSRIAGNIVCYKQEEDWLIGYWIGMEFWGKGVASRALLSLLEQVAVRPLTAYVAKQNLGSIRVLQKCGFKQTEEITADENSKTDFVEEFVFTLI